jgi:hypothetical protein
VVLYVSLQIVSPVQLVSVCDGELVEESGVEESGVGERERERERVC